MEFHGQDASKMYKILLKSKGSYEYDVKYSAYVRDRSVVFHCHKTQDCVRYTYVYPNSNRTIHKIISIQSELERFVPVATYLKVFIPAVDITQLPESVNLIIQDYADCQVAIEKRRSLRLREPVTVDDSPLKRFKK